MNPHVATLAFAIGILGLFALQYDRRVRTSKALWIPTVWVLIAASRFVSQWITVGPASQTTRQQMEGSPLDRAIFAVLLVFGIIVLLCRVRRLVPLLKMNGPILLFFLYCAVSTMWSDHPDMAARRWIKAIGDLVMVLIILTDRDRTEAIKRVIARVGFLLIPLSVLLIEYYPSWGSMYSLQDMKIAYTGVTTNKNLLGLTCLIIGLGCVWLLIKASHARRRRNRQILAHGILLAMVLWLLIVANSMTALACFLLGTALIIVLKVFGGRRPANVHFIVGGTVLVAALMLLLPELYVSAIHALGRNTTLSGRVVLWKALLRMDTHPWLGAGFESFWLGSRLNHVWSIFAWHPNEAHNGYIEVYLNLGLAGLGLLTFLIVTGYRNVIAAFRCDPDIGILRLGYFAVAVAYSFTEAGFRLLDPMWIFFLLSIAAVPIAAARENGEVRPDRLEDYSYAGLPADGEHIYARVP